MSSWREERSMVVAHSIPNMGRVVHDFSRNPLLVYWEMTQACGLACKHCRAEAMPKAHPLELTPADRPCLQTWTRSFHHAQRNLRVDQLRHHQAAGIWDPEPWAKPGWILRRQ